MSKLEEIDDSMIVKETGKRWGSWKEILTYFDAEEKDNKLNSDYLIKKYHLTLWWAKMLVLKYKSEGK